jgi:hypothetical protein
MARFSVVYRDMELRLTRRELSDYPVLERELYTKTHGDMELRVEARLHDVALKMYSVRACCCQHALY